MRKILGAAAMCIIAMAYVASPEVIGGAIAGTVDLGMTIVRVGTGVVSGGGTAPAGQSGGRIETLPDGSRVWVPDGATLEQTRP